MIFVELFLGFLKVGCFAFGGAYGAIPLIRDVVRSYGWLSDDMLSYMIAVSESTPGPIMVNLATYIGSDQAGLAGAAVATLAVVLPSFLVILLITALLKAVIQNRYVQAVLRGVKPCVIGIVLATGSYMIFRNVFSAETTLGPDMTSLGMTGILAGVLIGYKFLAKKKLPPILLLVISAAVGILVYGI